MQDGKKKRLSMLDNLVVSQSSPSPAVVTNNRALRSARDAVDAHRVWELEPEQIDDTRFADRLDPNDVADLRQSIDDNGQTVPILVRRHPSEPDRYLLVYGRRRLEAIRSSTKVGKVRALIANLDDIAALQAQVVENTARRDLSYIERALFAKELLESEFGNQSQIAAVLNVTKSAISMALSVAQAVPVELARAIGPAHGIGRPRWEALIEALAANTPDLETLIAAALHQHEAHGGSEDSNASALAFQAVLKLASQVAKPDVPKAPTSRKIKLSDGAKVSLKRTETGLRLDLSSENAEFLAWLEQEAQALFDQALANWQGK